MRADGCKLGLVHVWVRTPAVQTDGGREGRDVPRHWSWREWLATRDHWEGGSKLNSSRVAGLKRCNFLPRIIMSSRPADQTLLIDKCITHNINSDCRRSASESMDQYSWMRYRPSLRQSATSCPTPLLLPSSWPDHCRFLSRCWQSLLMRRYESWNRCHRCSMLCYAQPLGYLGFHYQRSLSSHCPKPSSCAQCGLRLGCLWSGSLSKLSKPGVFETSFSVYPATLP